MVAASFVFALFFALAVVAHPVERTVSESLQKLSFTRHFGKNVCIIVEHDLLRFGSMIKSDIFTKIFNTPANNIAINYVASVGVGSPPTNYDLVVDSGSSNTWVKSTKPYVKTRTSHQTSQSVFVPYGIGNFSGTEFIDQITISPNLVIPKQSIGVANRSFDASHVDGVIGIGPTNLTKHTLSPDVNSTIPTVMDNLFADGLIAQDMISVSFEPITNSSGTQMNGELTWGGIDFTKFIGDITFVPITKTHPASSFWGIEASMSYGDTSIQSTTAGIVDTGTTIVYIPTKAFNEYQKLTGGVLDKATQLLKITPDQFNNLKSFFVFVNGVPFELIPNAQLWPRNLNTLFGGTAGSLYLVISDNLTKSGSGLDFLLGQAFLERFYSVYDTGNHRVGLAKTRFTDAITN